MLIHDLEHMRSILRFQTEMEAANASERLEQELLADLRAAGLFETNISELKKAIWIVNQVLCHMDNESRS